MCVCWSCLETPGIIVQHGHLHTVRRILLQTKHCYISRKWPIYMCCIVHTVHYLGLLQVIFHSLHQRSIISSCEVDGDSLVSVSTQHGRHIILWTTRVSWNQNNNNNINNSTTVLVSQHLSRLTMNQHREHACVTTSFTHQTSCTCRQISISSSLAGN